LPDPFLMTYLPRPLDPGEAFFTLSDQFSSMNFVVFAERTGDLMPDQIRQALDALQQENALLQARIDWFDEKGLCFEVTPGPLIHLDCIPLRSDRWLHQVERQLSLPFALGSAPLMRCVYLELHAPEPDAQPPGQCVLALCFHHAIADGRAGIALLRRLLHLLAVGSAPAEHRTTTRPALPAMIDLMPSRYRWAEQPDAAKQLKATLITDYRRHGAPATLPWLDSANTARQPKLLRLRLSPGHTAQLIAQARQHDTSVHGVLCAAQLLAQAALQPGDAPTTFMLSSPVDMRAHLEPAPSTAPTGLFVSIVSATFAVSASTPLWPLAQDIVRQTRLQISRGEGHLFFNMFGLDGTAVQPGHMAAFQKKLQASLHNTMVSNVGPVATVPDDPAVDAISFALCPMPYQALFTAASTYQGQLILNVGFDAEKLAPATAQTLVQHIHSQLLTAAGSS